MGNEELKPCPFCGGEACMYGARYMWVKCLYCGAETMGSSDEKKAIDAWNRRAGEDNAELDQRNHEAKRKT